MIWVMTGSYSEFQHFLQHFYLREDFSQNCIPETLCIRGSCRRGQVRYLGSDPLECCLRGNRHSLVLCWGNWFNRPEAGEVEDYCEAMDIPFIEVPDLPRRRAQQEHPEIFRK